MCRSLRFENKSKFSVFLAKHKTTVDLKLESTASASALSVRSTTSIDPPPPSAPPLSYEDPETTLLPT